ncbi:MAG TPA: hypothetical protein VH331_07290 [Allosphingosinicella sp.]|jgi:hypothetical protein|nr:hypothetical protein [Allosphingosinicella sp.]
MRLNSVTANRHIFNGEANGKPLRLLLTFDSGRVLRLQIAGDGEEMLMDNRQLDAAVDMGEYGQTDVADVTQSLFPSLSRVEVTDVKSLERHGRRVGVKLAVDGGEPFNFWVDDDELHWGDEAALVSHDWQDGLAPKPSERLEI